MTNPSLDPASLCLGHHDRPTEAQRPRLCDWCRGRLRGRLRALPALAVTVLADLGQQGAPPLGDRVTGSREPALPGGRWLELMGPASPDDWVTPGEHRADQHDLQPVPAILASWARLIAEERHLTLPERTRMTGVDVREDSFRWVECRCGTRIEGRADLVISLFHAHVAACTRRPGRG